MPASRPPSRHPGAAALLLLLATACATPTARLQSLEQRLLDARTVELAFRIQARGVVVADLSGTLSVTGQDAELHANGSFQGQSMTLRYTARGDQVGLRRTMAGEVQGVTLERPPDLRAGLLLGWTRMGLLHDLARMTSGKPPDGTDGRIDQWLRVGPADQGERTYVLHVDGEPTAFFDLVLDGRGLPHQREQEVHFPSGTMLVEERYRDVRVH